jgi:hypothetical protein
VPRNLCSQMVYSPFLLAHHPAPTACGPGTAYMQQLLTCRAASRHASAARLLPPSSAAAVGHWQCVWQAPLH